MHRESLLLAASCLEPRPYIGYAKYLIETTAHPSAEHELDADKLYEPVACVAEST